MKTIPLKISMRFFVTTVIVVSAILYCLISRSFWTGSGEFPLRSKRDAEIWVKKNINSEMSLKDLFELCSKNNLTISKGTSFHAESLGYTKSTDVYCIVIDKLGFSGRAWIWCRVEAGFVTEICPRIVNYEL